MIQMNRILTLVLLGLLLVNSLSCTQSDEEDGARAQGTEKSPEVTVLTGDALEAVDLVIVMNSVESARGWNRTLDISPALQERISKYDGKVQFNVEIKGVNEPLLSDGAKTEIPPGAKFNIGLTGALNADVQFEAGEIGVLKGEIFVSQETKVTVNGNKYRYAQGQWIQTSTGIK